MKVAVLMGSANDEATLRFNKDRNRHNLIHKNSSDDECVRAKVTLSPVLDEWLKREVP